jgi:tetraacyldisaccharide 4'-kinase
VAAIARLLRDHGHRPAVLSRGYGRRERVNGVVIASDGTRVLEPVERTGDEPQMLARGLTGVAVCVSPDRYAAGLVAHEQLGATVLILDDGFQHVQLARTVDLVIASEHDLADTVLPVGRLREPLAAARVAHALLVPDSEDAVARVGGAIGVRPVFRIASHYRELRALDGTAAIAAGAARRVVAVAGIARPSRFFGALRSLGYEVLDELAYRDHHWFTPSDVARVEAAATGSAADLIVTTEKDAARLVRGALPRSTTWAYLPLHVTIEPQDEFLAWLRTRL